jgi:hypothetical protein
MKEINSQLTDAMIIALLDAFDTGVNFSDASEIAMIPEVAISEANEYWHLLSTQNDYSSSILPDASIIDTLFARLDTYSPEAAVKEATPSPYMKYVMVFAAPLSILVMILGISFRKDSIVDIKPSVSDSKVTISANNPATNALYEVEVPNVSPGNRTASDRSAKTVITPEIIANEDPKQLFAMISEAGTHEVQSEVEIDNEYDAQLSALDSKVIDSDNSNTYAPL